jgi:serine/threonine-protein kinase
VASVEIGEIIAGKYRHEGVVGEGPLSVVIAAHAIAIQSPVRIKVLRADLLSRIPEALVAFRAEGRVAAKFSCPFNARVFGSGELPDMGPFVVYEGTDAVDLCSTLESCGQFEVEQSVELAMQACEALAEAHVHGVVHLGVSTRNLLVAIQDGRHVLKVVDFGISTARLAGAKMDELGLPDRALVATLRYMAPEQLRNATPDARADVWAVGCVLYEMLSGKPAFPAETSARVREAILGTTPFPLVRRRPEVPDELAGIVTRCLAKDPNARFGDVAELAMALIPFGPRTAVESARRSSRYLEHDPAMHQPPHSDAELGLATTPYLPSADDSSELEAQPPEPDLHGRGQRGRRAVLIAGTVAIVAVGAAALALGRQPVLLQSPTAIEPAATLSAPPLLPAPLAVAPLDAVPAVTTSVAAPVVTAEESDASVRPHAPSATAPLSRPPASSVVPRPEGKPRRRPDLGY